MKAWILLLASLAFSPPALAESEFLAGAELEAVIVDKTIRGEVYYDSGETAFYAEYNGPDGKVISYTFFSGDSSSDFLYAESLGRWKIVGDKFCYRWQSQPEEIQCNLIRRDGPLYFGYDLLDQSAGAAKDNLRLFYTIEAVEEGDQTGDLQALYSSFGESL